VVRCARHFTSDASLHTHPFIRIPSYVWHTVLTQVAPCAPCALTFQLVHTDQFEPNKYQQTLPAAVSGL
jgi:hypothetical protein